MSEFGELFRLEADVLVPALADDVFFDAWLLGSSHLRLIERSISSAGQILEVLVWERLCTHFERRNGVVTEDESHSIFGPAIEILGQRECCVTAQEDVGEASFPTQLDGLVEDLCRALLRGPVSAS